MSVHMHLAHDSQALGLETSAIQSFYRGELTVVNLLVNPQSESLKTVLVTQYSAVGNYFCLQIVIELTAEIFLPLWNKIMGLSRFRLACPCKASFQKMYL